MSELSWFEINALSDRWSSYMVTSLRDASIGLALVLCIYLLVRRHVSPRWCYLLFLIVPLKLLLPIPLPLLPTMDVAADPPIASGATVDVGTKLPSFAHSPRISELPTSTNAAFAAHSVHAGSADIARQGSGRVPPSPTTLLMFAWTAIVLGLGGRFTWNQFRLKRLLAGAIPISLSDYGVDLDAINRRLCSRRDVAVTSSDHVQIPAVVGLWHSKIVLPSALLQSLEPRQLECIVAHELAHVCWYDVPVAMLERLVRTVHFMNPAVWIAGHMTHSHRENACDDASLLATDTDRRTCGSTLLRVLEFAHGQQRAAVPVVALFERSQFHQRRLRRIMTSQIKPSPAGIGNILLLLVIAAALLPNLRAAPPTLEVTSAAGLSTDEPPENGDQQGGAGPAQEPIAVVEEGPLVERVYDIKQLLQQGTDAFTLAGLITNSILVSSWNDVGGPGTISVEAEKSQLRVKNVASVQQATGRLIETFKTILKDKARRGPHKPLTAPRFRDMFVHFQGAPFEQVVRIYEIPSLLYADPSNMDPRLADYDSLIELVTSTIDPDSWDNVGGPGNLNPWPAGDALIVAQSRATHDKILKLCAILNRFPPVMTRQLSSVKPVEAALSLGIPFNNLAAAEFQTKVYPVHDLLPSETRPSFRLSPRAIGIEQLCDWLVTKAAPDRDSAICVRKFAPRGAILLAATKDVHQELFDALTELRRRMSNPGAPVQQTALARELFPPLFQPRSGFYPGSEGPVPYRVYLYGTGSADEQLAKFAQVDDQIGTVQLIATDVTDEGLATIAKFSNLYRLTIWSKGITDGGIAHLKALRPMQLALHGKQITDRAVEHLVAMNKERISFLDVSRTSISDDGLLRLIEHKRWLNVSHTNVTPATVESLRKKYPRSMIIFEQ